MTQFQVTNTINIPIMNEAGQIKILRGLQISLDGHDVAPIAADFLMDKGLSRGVDFLLTPNPMDGDKSHLLIPITKPLAELPFILPPGPLPSHITVHIDFSPIVVEGATPDTRIIVSGFLASGYRFSEGPTSLATHCEAVSEIFHHAATNSHPVNPVNMQATYVPEEERVIFLPAFSEPNERPEPRRTFSRIDLGKIGDNGEIHVPDIAFSELNERERGLSQRFHLRDPQIRQIEETEYFLVLFSSASYPAGREIGQVPAPKQATFQLARELGIEIYGYDRRMDRFAPIRDIVTLSIMEDNSSAGLGLPLITDREGAQKFSVAAALIYDIPNLSLTTREEFLKRVITSEKVGSRTF